MSEVTPWTSTGKFLLNKVWSFVCSKTGTIKWKPCLKTLLYLPKNSTVLTVFGWTILTDNAIKNIHKNIQTAEIAGLQAIHPKIAKTSKIANKIGVKN